MIITDIPGAAFDKISMDIMAALLITNNGNMYILTVQDLLTKYVVAVLLAQADSFSIAEVFLKHFICINGAPRSFLTDQAPTFFIAVMRTLAN